MPDIGFMPSFIATEILLVKAAHKSTDYCVVVGKTGNCFGIKNSIDKRPFSGLQELGC